jgi:ribose-phosphate pyrophosphokinase
MGIGSTHVHSDRMMYGGIKLYAGTSCPELAGSIATYLDVPLCERDIVTFPNDNLFVKLHSSVRGQDCYIIQTTSTPVHRNLMELLILIQTLRLDSAARVTAVVPYLCYSRSDKKDQPRVPITARLVADMIEVAGADRYMTFDLHADQIQGFFSLEMCCMPFTSSLIIWKLSVANCINRWWSRLTWDLLKNLVTMLSAWVCRWRSLKNAEHQMTPLRKP